jgi:hypothetical protein
MISEVDDDCNITFSDGRVITCRHRPRYTFTDCDVGYGSHGECPKWNYNNRKVES